MGPTKGEQEVSVSMNDNFYPHITWSVPLRNHRDPALTHVRRTQGFYTWLVAKNVNTSEPIISLFLNFCYAAICIGAQFISYYPGSYYWNWNDLSFQTTRTLAGNSSNMLSNFVSLGVFDHFSGPEVELLNLIIKL